MRYPKLFVYCLDRPTPNQNLRESLQSSLTLAIDEIRCGYVYQGTVIDKWSDRILPLGERPGWKSIMEAVGSRGRPADLVVICNPCGTLVGNRDMRTLILQKNVDVVWDRASSATGGRSGNGRRGYAVDTRLPAFRMVRTMLAEFLRISTRHQNVVIHPSMKLRLPWIEPLFKAFDTRMTDVQIAGYLNDRKIDCPTRLHMTIYDNKWPLNKWMGADVREWRESFRQWHLLKREYPDGSEPVQA